MTMTFTELVENIEEAIEEAYIIINDDPKELSSLRPHLMGDKAKIVYLNSLPAGTELTIELLETVHSIAKAFLPR